MIYVPGLLGFEDENYIRWVLYFISGVEGYTRRMFSFDKYVSIVRKFHHHSYYYLKCYVWKTTEICFDGVDRIIFNLKESVVKIFNLSSI